MRSLLRGFTFVFWNTPQRRLRAFWRIVIQFVMLIGLLLVSIQLLTWFVYLIGLDPYDSPFVPVFGAVQTLVIAASVLLCSWMFDRRSIKSLGMRMGTKWNRELLIGFAMGAAAMSILFGIEYLMGWIEIQTWGPRDGYSMSSLFLSQCGLLMLMICVGISEELLSRGYHLKNMSEGFRRLGYIPSVLIATLLSSSIFGLLHMGNNNANAVSILGIVLAGLMLALGRIVTGSLAAPIGLHISWNYFQGPVYGFAVSGNELGKSFFQIQQQGDPLWTGGAFGPEAGLLGIFAVCALGALFVCWPEWNQRRTRTIAALARFRRRTNPKPTGIHANSPIPTSDIFNTATSPARIDANRHSERP